MPQKCVVASCSRRGDGMHCFPKPDVNPDRFQAWVNVIQEVSGLEPMFVYRTKRVCRIHFEEHTFRHPSRRLFAHAVPTLHIAVSNTVSLPPARSSGAIHNDHNYVSTVPVNMKEKSAESSQKKSVANLPASPPSPTSNNYSDDDSDDDPDYLDPKRKRGTATDTDDDSDDSHEPEPKRKRKLVTATDTGPGQTAEAVDCNLVNSLITSDKSKPQYFSAQETKSRVPKMSAGIQTGLNDIFQSAFHKPLSTIKQYEEKQETSGNHVSSNKPPIFLEFHDQDEIISEQMEHKKQQENVEKKIVSNIEPIAFKFPNTDEYYMHDPINEREEQDSNMPIFYKVEVLDSPSVSEDSCDDMEDREIEEQELEEGEIQDKDEEIHNLAGLVISELKSLKSMKTVNYVIKRVTNILVKAHLGKYDDVRPSNESRIDGTKYA